jgi:O-methyltransferase
MLENCLKFWETEQPYVSFKAEIGIKTIVHPYKFWMLREFCGQAKNLHGEVCEVGVYKGGSAKLLAKYCPDKTVYLFDTFDGMPDVDPTKDVHHKGDFADTSVEGVTQFLSDCNNVRIFKGFFPNTATPIENLKFSLVHVDVDIFTSVKACCEFFYPRMVSGGIIVFDDYAVLSCPGATLAVDEFFSNKLEKVIRMVTSGSFVIKIS